MLELEITTQEGFDDEKQEFVAIESTVVKLEHSLVSLSKWESKWEKPFLDKKLEKSDEMVLDYIRFMILNEVDVDIVRFLDKHQIKKINEYINSSQTASWFQDTPSNRRGAPQSKIVTSDLIYYWMVAMTIPFECQHWHLNRLMTLIRITELENRPKKKMSGKENMSRHRSLNQARRARQGMAG